LSRAKRKTRNRNNLIDYNNYVNKKQEVNILPRNVNQETYLATLQNQRKDIVFAIGPAGTGKTLIGVIMAIRAFKEKQVDKIVITRPAVSVDEKHGYLPGNLEQKMEPWTRPIFDVFAEYFFKHEIKGMIEEDVIEIAPLAYMRGRTFKNAFIIADEMQNATPSQMKMLLTRIGKGSRMVVTGDLQQADRMTSNGLLDFTQKVKSKNLDRLAVCNFEKGDVERHEAVKEVLDIYGED
jgi:phosphate starvation-inducible PhoH-like protein|tara:strand:- start:2760 stop:3470 length:711 start_codon:yes stop_codon:yes gene_type:complete